MIYLEKRYYLCIEDIKGLTDGGTVEKNRAQEVTWFVWKSTCLSSYTYWLLLLNFLPNYSQRPKDMDGHHVNLSISQNTDPLSLFRWKDLSRSVRLLFCILSCISAVWSSSKCYSILQSNYFSISFFFFILSRDWHVWPASIWVDIDCPYFLKKYWSKSLN